MRVKTKVRFAVPAAVLLAAGCATAQSSAPAVTVPLTGSQQASLTAGAVSTVRIPAISSAFRARDAKVYLPPGYGDGSAKPPVLVLLSGVPGDVADWFDEGEVVQALDEYATEHGGRLPVIIAPDDTGVNDEDLLCMDSPLGNVDAYLSQDVPAWVNAHLRVDGNTRTWAVAGVSYGGTCAFELAVRHPKLYPTFLDFSGEDRPMRETREAAIDEVFNGDEAAYDRQDPLKILETKKLPESAGVFAAGDDDEPFTSQMPNAVDAAEKAGMQVKSMVVPGGHDWDTWSTAFRDSLPFLTERMGLEAGHP
ncbi:alpha/beta hydrolase [Amycolatopsis sp. cg5]|uniref:alpha/beta hydrolase n=1 Tax=Amycolatopsis sp. cg5 TaxID=3238802 RepID=UPI003526B55A